MFGRDDRSRLGGERGRLDGPPRSMTPQARPAPRVPEPPRTPSSGSYTPPPRPTPVSSGDREAACPAAGRQPSAPVPPRPVSQFRMNRPTVIALLYIGSVMFAPAAFAGVIFAYSSRGERRPEWEMTHYTFLVRTFWIGFLGILASIPLFAVGVGIVLLPSAIALVIVRSVIAINHAQKSEPIPNPRTWLI